MYLSPLGNSIDDCSSNRVRALQGLRRIPEARELLAEALDLYPNDHSLKEHHQRLSGLREGPLGADVLHNLPLPDGHALVGREAEERRVREVLRPYPHSQHPALTIDGVGGVGKTALAKRIAYDYVARGFSGGDSFFAVVWTSAKANALEDAGIQQRSPTLRNLQDIYSAIAMTVRRPDILAAQPESHDRLIRELLSDHDKRVLLIVDNLETVDDQRVIAFLRDLPAPTKVIVTTRHRLEGRPSYTSGRVATVLS